MTQSICAAAFSPDSGVLLSGGEDQQVRLWRVLDGRELFALKGHTGIVFSVAFSPDFRLIASGAEDHTVRLWKAADGKAQSQTVRVAAGDVARVSFALE